MKIKLTGFVDIEGFSGNMGDVVEVTPELQKTADFLLEIRAAVKIAEAVVETAPEPTPEKDDDDEGKSADLELTDAVDKLTDFGIHGRYIKALKDASILTVAQVKERSEKLSDVAGISDAAAKQIAAVLTEELDE